MAKKIGIGSAVMLKKKYALKKGYRQSTIVQSRLSGIKGGLVLAECLEEIRCWNVEHLELDMRTPTARAINS